MLASNTDGLQALHLLLIKARAKAFEHPDSQLGEILDTAEYLVTCLSSEREMTEDFGKALLDLGNRFPEFSDIASNFESLSPTPASRSDSGTGDGM